MLAGVVIHSVSAGDLSNSLIWAVSAAPAVALPSLPAAYPVVELLGVATALDLLSRTEQVQAQGGMLVAETGKPRTS